jgi:hypothetical protein
VSRRPKRKEELRLPDWLAALIAQEGSESQAETWRRRIAKTGVVELLCLGSESKPDAIAARSPRCRSRIDYARDRPITDAMVNLVEALSPLDGYIRLKLAADDMERAAFCASELAKYRHAPGAPGPIPESPWAAVEDLLEVAMVVVYCRSFTGDARVGDKWLPPEGDERRLHDALMTWRKHVAAHADHTAYRSLVDVNAMLGGKGPPTLGLARTQPSAEGLRAVSEMCERQHARFVEAVSEMEPLVQGAMERAGVRTEE